MPNLDIQDRLIEIVEPVCEDAGYELVALTYGSDAGRWVVRIFIDLLRDDSSEGASEGAGVGFRDCETLSRELSSVLDVSDPVPHQYSLEVSSPGVDRPLRKVSHFQRFIGERAKVRLHAAQDGRKNFQGVLVSANENEIGIEVDGATFLVPPSAVASAKLVPNWDELMAVGKRSGGVRQAMVMGQSE